MTLVIIIYRAAPPYTHNTQSVRRAPRLYIVDNPKGQSKGDTNKNVTHSSCRDSFIIKI